LTIEAMARNDVAGLPSLLAAELAAEARLRRMPARDALAVAVRVWLRASRAKRLALEQGERAAPGLWLDTPDGLEVLEELVGA
jgi:hypothetical protein